MPDALRILGFAGSLRAASYNRALLRAAQDLAPPDMAIEIFDLAAIPLYNGDVEGQGDPEGVAAFKQAIRSGSRHPYGDPGIPITAFPA